MMKNIKLMYLHKRLLVLCSIAGLLTCISSCEDDGDTSTFGNPQIVNLISLGDESTINEGFPEELVRVEGTGLGNMKEIVFDGTINTFFNTALNSDVALFFNVPFDADAGSRFGIQTVRFTNQFGESVSSQFEIKQPAPSLTVEGTFSPPKGEGGVEIRAFGNWFFNVEDILIDGESVGDFTVVSPQELLFTFPEGKTETTEFTVVTAAGMVSKDLPIEGGFIEYLLTDFDGNGVISGNWINYGDSRFRIDNGLGRDGTLGGELVWDDTGTLPFTGCTSEQSFSPVTTGTDAENAFLLIDVNADDFPGTVLEFVIADGRSDTWLVKPPLSGSGWQTVEIRISDFGFGFDPGNQGNGDPNPSTITKVNVQLSQEGGNAPIPSGYRFDNIRLRVLEQ